MEPGSLRRVFPARTRTIKVHRANLRHFGSTTTPRNRGGPAIYHSLHAKGIARTSRRAPGTVARRASEVLDGGV
jgi:hypothetical protein